MPNSVQEVVEKIEVKQPSPPNSPDRLEGPNGIGVEEKLIVEGAGTPTPTRDQTQSPIANGQLEKEEGNVGQSSSKLFSMEEQMKGILGKEMEQLDYLVLNREH